MHDARLIRERLDELREAMRRRGALEALDPQLDRCELLERQRRSLLQAVEERKAARNATSQEVARRKKAGGDAADLVATGRALGEEIGQLDAELATVEREFDGILLEIPNMTLADVPAGDESNNIELGNAEVLRWRSAALGNRRGAGAVRSRARREIERLGLHRLSEKGCSPRARIDELFRG